MLVVPWLPVTLLICADELCAGYHTRSKRRDEIADRAGNAGPRTGQCRAHRHISKGWPVATERQAKPLHEIIGASVIARLVGSEIMEQAASVWSGDV